MATSSTAVVLEAVKDLAHTAILYYLIYSVRVYLTARLERIGAEPIVLEHRPEVQS